MNYILGIALGTLIVLAIAIPRHILWCRREDRRFDFMVKIRDDERDEQFRQAGLSEEKIASFRSRVEVARKEAGF